MTVEQILAELDKILIQDIDTYSRADQQRVNQLRNQFMEHKATARKLEKVAKSEKDRYWAKQVLLLKNEEKPDGKKKYTEKEYESIIEEQQEYIELGDAIILNGYTAELCSDKMHTFDDLIVLMRDCIRDTEVKAN